MNIGSAIVGFIQGLAFWRPQKQKLLAEVATAETDLRAAAARTSAAEAEADAARARAAASRGDAISRLVDAVERMGEKIAQMDADRIIAEALCQERIRQLEARLDTADLQPRSSPSPLPSTST